MADDPLVDVEPVENETERIFRLGDRVAFTDEAVMELSGRHPTRKGTITKFGRRNPKLAFILWDGAKTQVQYGVDWLRLAENES